MSFTNLIPSFDKQALQAISKYITIKFSIIREVKIWGSFCKWQLSFHIQFLFINYNQSIQRGFGLGVFGFWSQN
jgi:hypothetical protein